MWCRDLGLALVLALTLGTVGCDRGGEVDPAPEDKPKKAASAKKKETPKLSKEEVAAINKKVWDAGQAYLKKLESVHAALPKFAARAKKCDDTRIAAIAKGLTDKQPVLVDEEFLTFLATGKRPKEDPEEWTWTRQPIWLKDFARLRAEGETFDPDVPRGALQKATKYLPKRPIMGVIRFKKRVLPEEKNGKTFAGGFIADLFIMDVQEAKLLCSTPYDVDQGGKYVHFTPDEGKGFKTALEAAKVQIIRLAEQEMKKRLKTISGVLLAPPQFPHLGSRGVIPPAASPSPK